MSDSSKANLIARATDIMTAHVSRNPVPAVELPQLLGRIHTALEAIIAPPLKSDAPEPAVPIKKSIMPDFLICLEDGKKLKMMKRHLMSAYNLTPEAYRAKWGLPPDYPMVAPNYARRRSALAKELGLGVRNPAQE